MFRTISGLIALLVFSSALLAEPFWGSRVSRAVDTELHKLKPGQFIWKGNAAPFGPVAAVVNIFEQKLYFYRNGILIGVSTISTGKDRRSTPTGVFTVLEKNRYHRSRKYNNAPMPYTHRLTNDGIAMHAGNLPGYRASHGCIRLPTQFARFLFASSVVGMPVLVSNEKNPLLQSNPAKAISSVESQHASAAKTVNLSAPQSFRWQPDAAKTGPISIAISKIDGLILVYRNGIEIGRAKLLLAQPEKVFGTYAYIMQEGKGDGMNLFLHHAASQRWVGVEMVGNPDKQGMLLNSSLPSLGWRMPMAFAEAVSRILTPGTSLLITDHSILQPQITQLTNIAQKEIHQKTQLVKPPRVIAAQSPVATIPNVTEMRSLDAEIEKVQAQMLKIKKEVAALEKHRLQTF